ncbi:DUF1294 domain-containing protein [Neptunicoccus sediminis]|uniref:DUF1294 domain-containing protein n=1 Tax=Neptunicoccus sediminis TaxID=1892596 RepID=UPI0008461440|nr:DUF1294 domain-containing protein [Neptunicoccus sediminis]
MINFFLLLGAYMGVINLITFGLFQHDKRQAEKRGWRVPENTLLALAILGGSLGAKWGQYALRHKTRKQPFALVLNLILIAQILLVVLLVIPTTRQMLLS